MITNTIVLDDKVIGYKIKSGDISYSTCKDGLMSKPVFDSLIANGYKYFGNQIFETSDGKSIDTLPQIDYNILPSNERSEFDIADNLYTDEDVLEFIAKKPPKDAPKWKEPLSYTINTREELLNFLNECSKFPDDNPMSYLPLNSFTNPEALLSEKEYFSSEGLKIRNLIKNKEKYSFTKFIKLIETLDINSTATPLDIIDKFYSWGISGLRCNIYSKRILSSDKISRKDGVNIETTATAIQHVFVDKYGEPVNQLDKSWVSVREEKDMEIFLNKLTQSNEVLLTPYFKPIEIKSIEYVFETFRVEIAPESVKLIAKGYKEVQPTIYVTYPSGEYLPSKLWNLKNETVANTIVHNLKVQSLRNYIIDKIRINCDVSSYKMYRALGLSDYNATNIVYLKYRKMFLNKNGFINKEFQEKLSQDEIFAITFGIGLIEQIFISGEDVQQEYLKDLINKIQSSEINVDNIEAGIISDSSMSDTKLYNHIEAALNEFHMSYEQLYKIIDKLDPIHDRNMLLRLTDGKYYCELPVNKRAAAKKGFDTDFKNTMYIMAKTAMDWLYITEIFSEPGARPNRHVGVMAYCWKRINNKETSQIEDYIAKYVLTNSNEAQLKIDTATLVFQSYVFNTTRCTIRGKVITISNELKEAIASCVKEVYEGTTELSNNMMYDTDKAKFFICNATVTPYWVIPHRRPIPVSSIYYKWNYGKNLSNSVTYNKLKGIYLPNKDCYSLEFMRKSFEYNVPVRLIANTARQLGDFEYYGTHYIDFKNRYKGKPLHPYDELYPATADKSVYADEDRNEPLYLVSVYEDKKFGVKNICDIDTTGEVSAILHSGNIMEDNQYIKKFNGFIGKDLFAIDDFKTLKNIFAEKIGNIPLHDYIEDTLIFKDGTKIKYYEIENIDRSKYMIRQINGNLYIVYNSLGHIFRVSI